MTLHDRLREIEGRVAGHTPGPWKLTSTHIGPIECHDMSMGWETYSAFKDEDIEIARSAPDLFRIAREAVDQLENAKEIIDLSAGQHGAGMCKGGEDE